VRCQAFHATAVPVVGSLHALSQPRAIISRFAEKQAPSKQKTMSTPLILVLGLVLPYASLAFLGGQPRNLPSLQQQSRLVTAAGVSQLAAARTAASASAPFLGNSSTDDDDPEAFDWWKQWYPVALTRDLDSAVPTKVTLLGRDLVLWKEGTAAAAASGNPPAWRCFVDRCPHRMAPLSEGRVDSKTGHLQCAYHGWEFGGSGACSKIPQADPDADSSEAAAMRSRRACATALPTQEAQGMIWVWPDTSEEGLEAAKVVKPTLMEDVDEKAMSYLVVCRDMPVRMCIYLREGDWAGDCEGGKMKYKEPTKKKYTSFLIHILLPPPLPSSSLRPAYLLQKQKKQYGFDTLLENGIDPSHLPFAHHNIISNRNQAAFIDIKVGEIRKDGFDSAQFFPKRRRMLPSAAALAAAAAAGEGDSVRRQRQEQVTAEDGSVDLDQNLVGVLDDENDEARVAAAAAAAADELSPGQLRRKRALPPMVKVAQSLHFRPPTLLYQIINVTEVLNKIPFLPKRERLIRIVTYAIPTGPGRSRVMYRFLRNYFLPPFAWLRWPPEWIQHQRILRVLDSDTVFLHGQERERALLHPSTALDVDKTYYMPTAADGSVRALRKWLARFGAPKLLVPGLSSALPPTPDRRTLLDRYESHTKHCKVCRGALRNLGRLRHLIGFMSVMAFYLGLLGQSVYTRLAGGFLTVLGITGSLIIKGFEERFHFQPWDHGRNH